MANKKPDASHWRVAGLLAVAVASLAVPFILFRKSVKGTRDRTVDEVAKYLSNFIEGTGRKRDWDNFTSIPITSPQLEAIRIQAAQIPLPLDAHGRRKLNDLLGRAQKTGHVVLESSHAS